MTTSDPTLFPALVQQVLDRHLNLALARLASAEFQDQDRADYWQGYEAAIEAVKRELNQ
jgi:hypothetical protein